jgi:hypothetical protein
MNVILSLDDDLIKEVRKIAVDRDTTLTGLVRDYLEPPADQNAVPAANAGNANCWIAASSVENLFS